MDDNIILRIIAEIEQELYNQGYELLDGTAYNIDFNDNFIKITVETDKEHNFFNIEYIYNYKMYKNVFIKGME